MYFNPEVLKGFVRREAILSGVIVRIEKVGYALWGDITFKEATEKSTAYRKAGFPHPFEPKYSIASQPAKFVMETIHFLNDEDGLPGLVRYLNSDFFLAA